MKLAIPEVNNEINNIIKINQKCEFYNEKNGRQESNILNQNEWKIVQEVLIILIYSNIQI